jgi:signal transduction histidine kinase
LDQIVGLGTIASVLAVTPPTAVLAVLASGALTVFDRVATDATDGVSDGIQNGLYVVLFSITFVALGASSVAAARAADAAEADALRAATDAAADAARERERARINALVHDRVLATLLTAARRIPGSASHEREDARRALEGLQALLQDDEPAVDALTGEELAWQIQAVTTDLMPEATFGYDVHAELRIDPVAAEALSDAVEEAVRNSLKHSEAQNRAVHVGVDTDGVRIDVLDDGVGFDRSRVPATRLGIAESIEGRMNGIAGGSAVVVSTEGVGTRVQLRWRPS